MSPPLRLDYGMGGARWGKGPLWRRQEPSSPRRTAVGGCPHISLHYFRSNKSPATKTKNRTEITPFIVKKAALNLLRSSDETSECSYASRAATRGTPATAILPRPNDHNKAISKPS